MDRKAVFLIIIGCIILMTCVLVIVLPSTMIGHISQAKQASSEPSTTTVVVTKTLTVASTTATTPFSYTTDLQSSRPLSRLEDAGIPPKLVAEALAVVKPVFSSKRKRSRFKVN
ncbi:uncharacterized protein VTP21DRAFT_9324 [Calcarisporiella thermophila]|uniref:uncharacterized protein n=1 Tax=Calcarisporiella thermophila TaxID=911321 RepID=UPI003742A761